MTLACGMIAFAFVVASSISTHAHALIARTVVENAFNALSLQRMHTWSKSLDQNAIRRRLALTSDPIINGGFQFEILSQSRNSPDRYSFRVRAKKQSEFSGFFGMHGALHSRDYSVILGRECWLEVGDTVMDARDYQIGMIVGRESFCSMGEDWIEKNNIDALPRGREQHFYMLLPDSRSAAPHAIRYVAEDLLLKADMEHLFQHPLRGIFLEKEKPESSLRDDQTENDVRNPQGKAGCWLIHDIRPWD